MDADHGPPSRTRLVLPDWPRRFPGSEPVGHRMRESYPDRWVRFHSLPDSKRYPETEGEYATVLDRHNRLLGELAGPGQEVVLLTTGCSGSPESARRPTQLHAVDPTARPWRTVPMHVLEGDVFDAPAYWHVFASRRVWRPGEFDPVVRLVADWAVTNVLVVSPDCRWLVYPYDGGMDVIAESAAARDRLRSLHPDWLSAHPAGL